MISRAPMGTICSLSVSGIGGTEWTAVIQCDNGRKPHTHELWCLRLDMIIHKFHPTELVEVTAGTVAEVMTNYLAENGHRIEIIGKLYINDNVQILGLSCQAWGSGLPFIPNLLDNVEDTGWGGSNNFNKNWGERFNNSNSITNVALGASADPRPINLP